MHCTRTPNHTHFLSWEMEDVDTRTSATLVYQQESCYNWHHKRNSNICMCCSRQLKQRQFRYRNRAPKCAHFSQMLAQTNARPCGNMSLAPRTIWITTRRSPLCLIGKNFPRPASIRRKLKWRTYASSLMRFRRCADHGVC